TQLSGATISLTNANVFNGKDVALSTTGGGANASITADALKFAASSVGGNLTATASAGTITQSGPLAVTGTSGLTATGAAITLTNAGNDFRSTVTATGTGIQLTDTNALTAVLTDAGASALVAGTNLTLSGSTGTTLTTTSTAGTTSFGATTVGSTLSTTAGGAVSQTGTVAVTGTSNINAGANAITLTTGTNDFGGAVTLTGGTTQITDTNALI